MQITCLIENTSTFPHLSAEHGLSLYIEANGKKILFDMGQTDKYIKNAKKMGIDLSAVDSAILSHGHYDHGGGMSAFMELNTKAKIYLTPSAFLPHYNGEGKYIGLDQELKNNERYIFTDDLYRLSHGITLYSCNQNTREYGISTSGMTEERDGIRCPDEFLHEQYLLIEDEGKKVLISGCSHKGILDIVNWFQPDVLVGGFHFSKLPLDEKLTEYAKHLNRYNTNYFTCHCTGTEQYNFMKPHIRSLDYLSTGNKITV